MNKTFSALLVTTALTVPVTAFAQTAETACADLQAALAGDVSADIDVNRLSGIAADGEGATCLVELESVRQTMGTESSTSAQSDVTVADTAETTLTLQDEVTVEGRVLLEQTPPRVDVAQGEMDVEIEPGAPTVTVAEGQGEIVVRQAPANVTINMPVPTITIEQAAPEIIVTMPDPDVTVGAAQPTVRVVQADPVISVTQAPPAVELELQRAAEGSEGNGFEVTDSRSGQAYQSGVTPEAITTEDAEVNVTKSEPRVVLTEPTEQAQVSIEKSEPTVRFEQSDPIVNVTSEGEPQVEFIQSGEPTVTFEQAANAEGEGADVTAPAALAEQAANEVDAPDAEVPETEAPEAVAEETASASEAESVDTEVPVELAGPTGPAVEREGYTLARAGEYEVETLTGSNLYGVGDEDIGEIGDLVLSDGQVSDVIVEVGGFLGLGEKEVLIPFERLSVLRSNDGDIRVYIDSTEEELEAMPAAE